MKYAKDRKLTSSHTAEVLIEAFPYIKNQTGKTIVIKYGGAAMVDPKLRDAVMSDIMAVARTSRGIWNASAEMLNSSMGCASLPKRPWKS